MRRAQHVSKLVVPWLLLVSPARAQTESAPRGLTFAEALERVSEHPDVRAPLAAAGVLGDARVRGANGYPSISAQAGFDTDSGQRVRQGQISPTYTFILMRQGRAARDSVTAHRATVVAEARAALLTHQLEVAEAWLTLHATEALLVLLQEEADVLDTWLAQLDSARQLRAATVVDIAEVQAQRADVAQEMARWRMESEGRERAIVRALALPVAARVTTEGDPPDPRPDQSLDPAAVASHLPASELARRRAEYAAVRTVYDLSTYWPGQVSVGAQIGLDSRSVVGVINLQAPLASAQRAERAHDEADRARAEVEQETSVRQTEQLVAETQTTLASAQRALAQMREDTIPRHEALLNAQLQLRAVGEATTFAVLEAKRRLLEARTHEAVLDVTERVARVRLELLLEAAGPMEPEGDPR